MYLRPKEAMELLEITTRQGLHKIVKNHNITVKSQGVGKPNLYLKADLERYKKENKNLVKRNGTVKKKVQKREATQKKIKKQNQEVIQDTKKIVNTETVKDFSVVDNQDNQNQEVIQEQNINEIKNNQEEQAKKQLDLPKDDEIENPLNKVGMAEYERVTNLLIKQGTYEEVDRSLVLAYAISYQKYIFSTVASGKQDDTTIDSYGNLKLHPYFQVAKESFNQMEKISKLLGIGARSRVGLEIKQEKKESIFDILNTKEEFD